MVRFLQIKIGFEHISEMEILEDIKVLKCRRRTVVRCVIFKLTQKYNNEYKNIIIL